MNSKYIYKKPQFLFILGTTRCGKKLVKCLLDDHPDILVWPEEFPYFTYFQEFDINNGKAPVSDLNKGIIDSIFKVKK